MDWELAVTATVPLTLVAIVFCISHRLSKNKRKERKVGYLREEIHIDAENVPEFKPTWRDTR